MSARSGLFEPIDPQRRDILRRLGILGSLSEGDVAILLQAARVHCLSKVRGAAALGEAMPELRNRSGGGLCLPLAAYNAVGRAQSACRYVTVADVGVVAAATSHLPLLALSNSLSYR